MMRQNSKSKPQTCGLLTDGGFDFYKSREVKCRKPTLERCISGYDDDGDELLACQRKVPTFGLNP